MVIVIDIIKFVVLVVVTFFTAQIITNKNKRVSIIGTFLISCSTAVVEYINSGLVESLIFGQLLLISLNALVGENSHKYIAILGLFISFLGYSILSNLSFQFSIGLALIPIIIWIMCKNKKEVNLSKIQNIVLVITVVLAILISIFFYKINTLESLEKVNGLSYLMSYTYSYNIPFDSNIKFVDSSCLATFTSVFPMVLFVAVFYIFKIEKHSEFLLGATIISILQVISISSSKALFENIAPNYIMSLGVALLQIYIMLYFFANVEEKLFKLKTTTYISIIGILFLLLIKFPTPLSPIENRMGAAMVFTLESFVFLNYYDKRFIKIASVTFPIITLIESIGLLIVKIM